MECMEEKDEILYQRYLAGEESVINTLVNRYGDRLMFYICGYIHDTHAAEDLMMESFSLLLAKPRTLQDDGSFKSYLYKIGRNLTIQYVKKKLHYKTVSFDDLEYELESEMRTDAGILLAERNYQIHKALGQVPTAYREALYLFYFDEMNYNEVALVMKKNKKQVANLIERGRKALKAVLDKEGYFDDEFRKQV